MHKVEDHLRLVGKIAMRYSKITRMEFDDLYQEGCIGLMRACNEYIEGDVPFGAFAGQHIQFAIFNALTKNNLIYVSANIVMHAGKIKKTDLQDEPVGVIAEKLGISLYAATHAVNHLKREVLSIDYEYNNRDDDVMSLSDLIRDDVDFETELLLEQLTAELKPKEKIIVEMVIDGHSYDEIAKRINFSTRSVNSYLVNIRKGMRKRKGELLYG